MIKKLFCDFWSWCKWSANNTPCVGARVKSVMPWPDTPNETNEYYVAWNGEIWSSPFMRVDLQTDNTGGLIDKQGTSVSWDSDGYRGENWINLKTWSKEKMRKIESASA